LCMRPCDPSQPSFQYTHRGGKPPIDASPHATRSYRLSAPAKMIVAQQLLVGTGHMGRFLAAALTIWTGLRLLSAGELSVVLEALPGPNGNGRFAKTITQLKAGWWQDYEA